MLRSLRILGLVVLAFALVWAIVIVHWQDTHRLVKAEDVLAYLIALPLALLLGFWGLKLGIDRLRGPGAAADGAPAPDPSAVAATQAAAGVQERALSARLLAQFVHLPVGEDVAAAIEALADPGTHAPLDDTLRDADGFPVAAARIEDLHVEDALRGELEAIAPDVAWNDDVLRRAAALESVLARALDALGAAWPPPRPDTARGAAAAPVDLRVSVFLSERADESQRRALERWVAQRCAWPGLAQDRCTVSVFAVRNGIDALLALDRWILHAHKRAGYEVLLLVAAESSVSQDAVDAMAAARVLRTAAQPDGRSPGEGAAALALARADAPLSWPASDVHLSRIALGRRDKSADASGRIGADLLARLAEQVLGAAGIAADAVPRVFSDIDHRASRNVELGVLMNMMLPQLDPITDRCALGSGCGDVAAASGLAALALAAGQVAEAGDPALVLLSSDAYERGAAVLYRPPAPVAS